MFTKQADIFSNSLALERTASAWVWLMSQASGHWGLYASAKKEERNTYAACNMFTVNLLITPRLTILITASLY